MDSKKKTAKYSPRKLKNCLVAVRAGNLSQRQAAKIFGIPRSTIQLKLGLLGEKANDEISKRGPPPGLGRNGEKLIVDWAKKNADKGYPLTKDGLELTVKKIFEKIPEAEKASRRLKEQPGVSLVRRILKRHANEIGLNEARCLSKARSNVSENDIHRWFSRTEEILKKENCIDILSDPTRVFNTDETAIYLNPQGGKFIGETGEPTVRVNDNDDKTNMVTVLFTVSADGRQAPPFILYRYKQLPKNIGFNVPDNWGTSCNKNGRMTAEKFYGYIRNIFHPYLERNNIRRPVILFMDGHSSHLSLPLSELCAEHGIIHVCLIASATHILQPLDVSFFRQLKVYWQKHCRLYRLQNQHDIQRQDVAKEIEMVLNENESKLGHAIRQGF